jgi:hypothetical protein
MRPAGIGSWPRARSPRGASTITSPRWRRPGSCSTRDGAATSSATTPATSPLRKGSRWSRTRVCWRRSRAWSNGRWS